MREAAVTICEWLQPRAYAISVLACIALLGVLGYIHQYVHGLPLLWLDGEVNIPAGFSAMLLMLAAAFAYVCWHADPGLGRSLLVLGGLFAFMSLDEVMEVHEHLDHWTGVAWQILYVPIVAAGGITWLIVLLRFEVRSKVSLALMGGAAAWFVAQIFEIWQRGPAPEHVLYHPWMIFPEELGEMCGSMLFGLATLIAAKTALQGKIGPRENSR